MKKYIFLFSILLIIVFTGCANEGGGEPQENNNIINAAEHGVSVENSGESNSRALQAIIDSAALEGKTVYIPAGEYEFAENGRQTIGSHCIKMRSGVSIIGDGEKTVLKPVGSSKYGLDMFYFNDYLDTGEAIYLENCRFESFVIDASGTSCEVYTSAGKGFMFNLFKNCHFKNVTVKNTDATGFGVDCPIDSTIIGCTAIGCGKAATYEGGGASGFGIGFGYSSDESIVISDCDAIGNKKFGFFLEHQGRFNSQKYNATPKNIFTVKDCFADENLFGFGGIYAYNTVYENCVSENSIRYGFYFEESVSCGAKACKSSGEGEACFAILQNTLPEENSEIYFVQCEGSNSPKDVMLLGKEACPRVEDCTFSQINDAE